LCVRRQNTFRPVFAPLLRSARPERKRVTQLRRLLADAGLLYDQLQDAWQQHKLDGTWPC
jgi:maternal protein exuperantia